MDYQLKGKLAYVSAGAHGIGEAIADLLTQEGAEVIVSDIDARCCGRKAGKWRGSIAADLATAEGVDTATAYVLAQFQRAPDILINNLGVGSSTPFEETSDEMWAQSFQVNLMGTVRTCRALVPQMAVRGEASVVKRGPISQSSRSQASWSTARAKPASCTSAKHSQSSTHRPCASIRCLPGPIWSRMWSRPGGIVDHLVEQYGLDRDASVKKFLEDRQMPMGIGNPEDVAHAVVFLASPLAKFITGAGLDIGGTIRGLT